MLVSISVKKILPYGRPGKQASEGPENKLIFASGPFSGTTIPCASRMAVTAKSPLAGAVGMALTGGHFPVELKFACFYFFIEKS